MESKVYNSRFEPIAVTFRIFPWLSMRKIYILSSIERSEVISQQIENLHLFDPLKHQFCACDCDVKLYGWSINVLSFFGKVS